MLSRPAVSARPRGRHRRPQPARVRHSADRRALSPRNGMVSGERPPWRGETHYKSGRGHEPAQSEGVPHRRSLNGPDSLTGRRHRPSGFRHRDRRCTTRRRADGRVSLAMAEIVGTTTWLGDGFALSLSTYRSASRGSHARTPSHLRTLPSIAACRLDRGDDLQLRVHVLPHLRRNSAAQRLPELRRRLVSAAGPSGTKLERRQLSR